MTQTTFIAISLAIAIGSVVLLAVLYFAPVLLRPGTNRGEHIAEVWLTVEGGRGSTMYRQRFDTLLFAKLYVKLYAFVLDMHLPTHYTVLDDEGNKVLEAHEYGIRFAVRPTTVGEFGAWFEPVWSTVLPGDTGFCGEAAVHHPVSRHVKEAAEHEAYPLSIA
jgi:hypothetical protein